MKSILEELFYGNICPNTQCRSKDKEVKELMGYISDHHDALMAEMNDKQRETFEKFDDCWDELTDINEREIFVYAFKLGMRIAIEVMSLDTDYFFAKSALFQNCTTTFLTTATRTFDHFCQEIASKNTIFGYEQTNLKLQGCTQILQRA